MPNKKKLIIFTGYFLPYLGGIERYTDKLTTELANKGLDITIVTTNHANLPLYEKHNQIKIYRLPTYKLFRARYPLPKNNKEYKEIMLKINQKKADNVICNTRFHLTTLIGLKYARNMKIRPIVIEHGSSHFSVGISFLDFFGKIYEHCLTLIIKRYDVCFYGVSERCSQWLKHFKINSKGVFYNSVDINAYNEFYIRPKITKPNKVRLVYAGRIIKEKGVEMLLEAFLDVSKNHKNATLTIAGDGPELVKYKSKYKNKNITFTGKLDYSATMSLLAKSDIFCHPSMYPEGLPTSLLEAGLMGCAVIATDRGGTIEVINDPRYGIIIDEDKLSLAKSISLLINDHNLRAKMQIQLQKRIIDNFTWDKTAKKILKVFKEVQ